MSVCGGRAASRTPNFRREEASIMASRSPQTQMKRARELALKERRERKREKKAARAAERRDGVEAVGLDETTPDEASPDEASPDEHPE